jgi:cephalosporin-C deacetylase-like acetyl esterase
MRVCAIVLLAVACAAAGPQGDARRHTAAERYELFKKNLTLRAQAITNNQFSGISKRADWERRRPELRRQALSMLGLDPVPPRTPLGAKITGGFERPTYRVENLVFESMPGLYVTGNLYLPKTPARGKTPAVLYVSGHAPSPQGAKIAYQHHGIWFARNGYVALVLDTVEFGEISGIHHGTHDLGMWYWLSLGYTPAGVEVWNAIRALDYLESRPEVDRARIGMTGRSGGGAITWFTAGVDERVAAAAPVHGTWSVGPHVADDVVRENCDCIYFWNSCRLDLPVVAALIAPRPLEIVNASKDGAFPPAGYNKVFELLRPVYDWYGASDKLHAFEQPTGHSDLPVYRKAANEWLNRWLRQDSTPFDETGIEPEEASLLTVLAETPRGARNEGIHRSFIRAAAPEVPKSLAQWQARRAKLVGELREHVFGAFPETKVPFDEWEGPERVWTRFYADSYNVEFTTEDSIRVHGQLFIPRNAKSKSPALIYVKGKEDVVYGVDYDDVLSALGTHVVLVLRPRAVDYPMDNYRTANTKMSAALTGTTLESLQLWDILRAIDYLAGRVKTGLGPISIYGRREMGALALYAAALDDRVERVILENPPASHWDGPAFLNVLRYTDLAEVAGIMAPREIVSLSALPASFELTRAIHQLHPFARALRQVDSLGDALR